MPTLTQDEKAQLAQMQAEFDSFDFSALHRDPMEQKPLGFTQFIPWIAMFLNVVVVCILIFKK